MTMYSYTVIYTLFLDILFIACSQTTLSSRLYFCKKTCMRVIEIFGQTLRVIVSRVGLVRSGLGLYAGLSGIGLQRL